MIHDRLNCPHCLNCPVYLEFPDFSVYPDFPDCPECPDCFNCLDCPDSSFCPGFHNLFWSLLKSSWATSTLLNLSGVVLSCIELSGVVSNCSWIFSNSSQDVSNFTQVVSNSSLQIKVQQGLALNFPSIILLTTPLGTWWHPDTTKCQGSLELQKVSPMNPAASNYFLEFPQNLLDFPGKFGSLNVKIRNYMENISSAYPVNELPM